MLVQEQEIVTTQGLQREAAPELCTVNVKYQVSVCSFLTV